MHPLAHLDEYRNLRWNEQYIKLCHEHDIKIELTERNKYPIQEKEQGKNESKETKLSKKELNKLYKYFVPASYKTLENEKWE